MQIEASIADPPILDEMESVVVRSRLFSHHVGMAVIAQPDGSLACLPASTLEAFAAHHVLDQSRGVASPVP
jgi:hypothetical protein